MIPGQEKRSTVRLSVSPGPSIEIVPAKEGSASTSRRPTSEAIVPSCWEISITQ